MLSDKYSKSSGAGRSFWFFWILRKEDEMLKRMIEDEIEYEKTTAKKLEDILLSEDDYV